MRKTYKTLEAMQREGLLLLVHGEVTDPEIDLFDREAVFIDTPADPAAPRLPRTEDRVRAHHDQGGRALRARRRPFHRPPPSPRTTCSTTATRSSPAASARTTTACRCSSARRTALALVEAATGGSDRFFLGTDSAPHAAHLKEHAIGCAGCYTAHAAIELYAEAFDAAGALDKLEGFASFHGADFYGLPRNTDTITLTRESWTLPETVPSARPSSSRCAAAKP